jgi:hypothetical protein
MVEINRLPVSEDLLGTPIYAVDDDRPIFVPDYARECEVFSFEVIAEARFLTGGGAQLTMHHDKVPPKPGMPYGEKQILKSELGFRAVRCADGTCPFPEIVKNCFRRSDQSASTDPTIFDLTS